MGCVRKGHLNHSRMQTDELHWLIDCRAAVWLMAPRAVTLADNIIHTLSAAIEEASVAVANSPDVG